MTTAADQHLRDKAIDPHHSFIVQAPAGSGKTELLTQRYLVLLCCVEKAPEEIIAITFTRKAAAEMRERILKSLVFASNNPEPSSEHAKKTWRLAKKALVMDAQHQWNLIKNPNRLRILTLDALAGNLCQQMPLLSELGANTTISEDTSELFEEAIHEFLTFCIHDNNLASLFKSLLLHLDNRTNTVFNLLKQLLSKREQWLPHVLKQHNESELRASLEKTLSDIITETLESIDQAMPEKLKHALFDITRQAAENLTAANTTHPICCCLNLNSAPEPNITNFDKWAALSHFYLKKDGSLRKTADKRQGILPKTELKSHVVAMLNTLQEYDEITEYLQELLRCPTPRYNEQQWHIISILLKLLPLLAAHLRLSFQKNNCIDFVELNLAALRALGTPEEPTDLSLHLDYRIKHILVDEFQDTSLTQFKLLESLTAGWQPNDGRTIFLVGDPMQSIYRFRQADVSLFLHAKLHGINDIKLESIVLKQNFRSNAGIVDWINDSFSRIFPKNADINTSAIPYSTAISADKNTAKTVFFTPCFTEDAITEAEITKQKILELQSKDSTASIAVLVRSRTHLREIIDTLNSDNISYQAIDIQPLKNREEIRDLVALTSALLDRSDKIAWLALLRAPFCGLSLSDLLIICNEQYPKRSIWQALQSTELVNKLSSEGNNSITLFVNTIKNTFNKYGRLPITQWIKGAWLELQMPASYEDHEALENCAIYFDLIDNLEQTGQVITTKLIRKKLNSLYAKPSPDTNSLLQIMTIHKSKGLEFDHVIIPNLNKRPAKDKSELLLWSERMNKSSQTELLMAPIKSCEDDSDPIYQYIQHTESQKLKYEVQRLFYVAATRAKTSLHLSSTLNIKEGEVCPPENGSLMNLIWPIYKTEINNTLAQTSLINAIEEPKQTQPLLKRLDLENITNYIHLKKSPSSQLNHDIDITPEDRSSAALGTIIHAILQQLSAYNLEQLKSISINKYKTEWTNMLFQANLPEEKINIVNKAISNILSDPKGLWILRSDHPRALSEYAISFNKNGHIKHYIIDRYIIDEDQQHWIIDYKTGQPDSNLNEDYRQQLNNYAEAINTLTNNIRCVLYYPLNQHWDEWQPNLTMRTHSNTIA